MLALVRPDSWNFPFFLHVLGATLLVGAVGATVIIATRAPAWRRLLARTMGLLVLPAWVLMRFAGQWIDSRENIPDDPAWVGIGFGVGDAGLVLLVITALIAWWGVRRRSAAGRSGRWP
jgi:ribose/xylose/arabinose/galactoside ABC-type transport system permease subunit